MEYFDMPTKNKPTIQRLNELFNDDHGDLVRKTDKGKAKAGDIAGCLNTCGYLITRIDGKLYYNHRIIYAMSCGYWPKEVDHIDGNTKNNRMANLREVTHQQNQRNLSLCVTNTSGFLGVNWDEATQKWRASIKVHNKNLYLGIFIKFEDAIAARRAANIKHGYHKNHGRR